MLVETESHINCVHLPQDSVCSVCSRMWHRYVNILPRFVLSTFIIVFPCASVTRLHTSPLATFASCAHCWFRTIHKMLTYPPYSHLQHISHIFTIQQQQQTAQRGSQNPISTRKLESARVAPCCNSHWRNSHHHSEAVETTDVEQCGSCQGTVRHFSRTIPMWSTLLVVRLCQIASCIRVCSQWQRMKIIDV